MHHSATPGNAPGSGGRRNLPHYPANGAAVDGGLVAYWVPMTYRYPLPPSANRYFRNYRGRMVTSDEAAQYKATLRMLAKVDGVKQLTGPVAVTVAVHRERKAGDLDNRLKILLDALQGVFYKNDAQVVEIHATLHDDRHDPRIEVAVTSCRNSLAAVAGRK